MGKSDEATLPLMLKADEVTLPLVLKADEATLPLVLKADEVALPLVLKADEVTLPLVLKTVELSLVLGARARYDISFQADHRGAGGATCSLLLLVPPTPTSRKQRVCFMVE